MRWTIPQRAGRRCTARACPAGLVCTIAAARPGTPGVTAHLTSLETRAGQMQDARVHAEGWPTGSGMAESANPLVAADRLNGSGTHSSVNPLRALRNAVWNDRWAIILAVKRQWTNRHAAALSRAPAPVVMPPVSCPAKPAAALLPAARPTHPWRKPWSVLRQREPAGVA